MDAIFMISGNNKTYDIHRHLLNLSDKMDLKGSNKYVQHLLYMRKYKKVVQKQ